MKSNKKMMNVLTLGLSDSDTYKPLIILSSEVSGDETQASIVEYCLTSAASNMEDIRSDEIQVDFVKETYNVKDTVRFKFETFEQSEACTEMFIEKVNTLVTTTDLDEVSGAAEFLDKLSEMVAEFEDVDGITVTVVSNILEKI